MKHFPLVLAFSLLICFHTTAQETKLTQNVLTATILEPGISYEASLGNKFTAKFRAGINAFVENSTNNGGIRLVPYPFIGAGARYYYGFTERNKKGKNTLRNSANYVGISAVYGGISRRNDFGNGSVRTNTFETYSAGLVWGLQRNYKNRFSLDLNIGPNIISPIVFNTFRLTGEFTLGIWLGKKAEQ